MNTVKKTRTKLAVSLLLCTLLALCLTAVGALAIGGAGTGKTAYADEVTPAVVYEFTVTKSELNVYNAAWDGDAIAGNTVISTLIERIDTAAAVKATADGTTSYVKKLIFDGGENAVDIGTASMSLTSGSYIIEGKLTGTNSSGTNGTVNLSGGASLEITGGTISNTLANPNARAIYNASAGEVKISGGTVSAMSGRPIYNAADGTITVSSGTVSCVSYAVYNASTGEVNISGGTVSSDSGNAVYNASTGEVNISGGTVSSDSGYAVYNYIGTASISGGTVKSVSGYAVYNVSTGEVNISDGTVNSDSGYAVYNDFTGTVSISGGTVSATTTGSAILNNSTGEVKISGGTVSATTGRAIYNGTGTVSISGGTVEATGNAGRALQNANTGTITVSGGTVSATTGIAIYNNSTGAVNISGGTVSSVSSSAVYNNSTGVVTISQDTAVPTVVTSANADATSVTRGTIAVRSTGTAAAVRLVITGGLIENTSGTGSLIYADGQYAVVRLGTAEYTGAKDFSLNIAGTFVYDGSAKTPAATLSVVPEANRTITYESNTDAGAATVKATLTGDHGTAVFATRFTIAQGTGSGSVTMAGWTYNGTASSPVLTGITHDGTAVITYSGTENGTYAATKPSDAGTYWVKVSYNATDNYAAYETKVSFTIAKAAYSGTTPAAQIESVTKTSITIKAVDGAEYSIDGGATWQDSNVFENLTAGTAYSAAVRIKGTDNVLTSASGSLDISTEKGGLSGGAIAGIVIACVLVAALGGFAIFWFVIKKKKFADLLAVFKKSQPKD